MFQIAGNAYTRRFTEAIEVEHLMAGEIVDSLKASTDAEQRARFITPPTQQRTRFKLISTATTRWNCSGKTRARNNSHVLNSARRGD